MTWEIVRKREGDYWYWFGFDRKIYHGKSWKSTILIIKWRLILAVMNAIICNCVKKPEKNSGLQRGHIYIHNAYNCVHNCEDQPSFDFISAVHMINFIYITFNINHTKQKTAAKTYQLVWWYETFCIVFLKCCKPMILSSLTSVFMIIQVGIILKRKGVCDSWLTFVRKHPFTLDVEVVETAVEVTKDIQFSSGLFSPMGSNQTSCLHCFSM